MLVVSSFAEVGQYLQGAGRVVKRFSAEDGDGYLFEVRHEAHTHLFGARVLDSNSTSWLALTVLICAADRLDPRRALLASAALPIGSLCIANANALLRQTLPLAALRVDHLERTIAGLAATATTLRTAASIPPATETDAPFAYAFH